MRIENESIMDERRKVFIEDSKKKFGNKFDYSKVGLINSISQNKVLIGCPKHGFFLQKASKHLESKYGCSQCGKEVSKPHIVTKPYKPRKDRWEANKKTRICSDCGIEIHYKSRRNFIRACRRGTVCNRCSVVIRRNYFANLKVVPFNEEACKFIDKLNQKTGWEIQHAQNGGEIKIEKLKYWLDGYDRKRKIVFEYDEPFHYDELGNLRRKDVERQIRIINLMKPSYFIRYDEKRDRLYEVLTGKEVTDYGQKTALF